MQPCMIPLFAGNTVWFDDLEVTLVDRNGDRCTVHERRDGDFQTRERHIDWFADQASHAGTVSIDKSGDHLHCASTENAGDALGPEAET